MDKSRIETITLPIFTVLAFVSFSLLTAGFFLPFWFGSWNISYGFWFARSCVSSPCLVIWYNDNAALFPTLERWEVVKILETIAVIFGFISLLFGVLMCVLRHKSSACRSVTQGTFFATSFLAGFMDLIGILIFISIADTSAMMWGTILPIIASLLFMASGIFTLVVCRYDPYYDPKYDYMQRAIY